MCLDNINDLFFSVPGDGYCFPPGGGRDTIICVVNHSVSCNDFHDSVLPSVYCGQHSSLVVNAIASQQEGTMFNSRSRPFWLEFAHSLLVYVDFFGSSGFHSQLIRLFHCVAVQVIVVAPFDPVILLYNHSLTKHAFFKKSTCTLCLEDVAFCY